MPRVLCLDDFTFGLAEDAQVLRAQGYEVVAAVGSAEALELAAEVPLDAVILNCHRDKDNAGLIAALRILQPKAAVVMFSSYCGVPCHQLRSLMLASRRRRHRQRSCPCCGQLSVRAVTDFAVQLEREVGTTRS